MTKISKYHQNYKNNPRPFKLTKMPMMSLNCKNAPKASKMTKIHLKTSK